MRPHAPRDRDPAVSELLALREQELGFDDAVEAWAYLDRLAAILKAKANVLRTRLMAEAEAKGTVTDKGGKYLRTGENSVVREKRVSTYDVGEMLALATLAGLPRDSVVVDRTVLEVDSGKVERLVQLGKLDKEKVEATRKVSFAFKAKPSKEVLDYLREALPKPEGLDEDRDDRRPW